MTRSTILLIGACTIACGHSGVPNDTVAAAQASAGAQPAAARDASATGSPECDDYVRLVSTCIETKMPESERAEARQELEFFRKAHASSPFAAMAGSSCLKNIRSRIQSDSYGCYAEEAAKRGIQTSCTVLTRAELEQLLGTSLEDGVQDSSTCTYAFAGQQRLPFQVTVHWSAGEDEMVAARGAQAMVNGRIGKETGMSGLVPGAAVEGVGDEAFFTVAGVWPMLIARLGDVAVGVEGAPKDQLVAVARVALPRIKPQPRHKF
jgi:hypothetical protein